jgi:hypothetical protein
MGVHFTRNITCMLHCLVFLSLLFRRGWSRPIPAIVHCSWRYQLLLPSPLLNVRSTTLPPPPLLPHRKSVAWFIFLFLFSLSNNWNLCCNSHPILLFGATLRRGSQHCQIKPGSSKSYTNSFVNIHQMSVFFLIFKKLRRKIADRICFSLATYLFRSLKQTHSNRKGVGGSVSSLYAGPS